MKKRRILVAGATGYLGGYAAREFKSQGHYVRALARAPGKLEPIKNPLDDIIKAEVTMPSTLEGVCDGIDAVFSSVGITKQSDGLTFRDVDYRGNLNLLEAAKAAGVKKFIYVSVFNGPNLMHLDIVRAHEVFRSRTESIGNELCRDTPNRLLFGHGGILQDGSQGPRLPFR